MQSQVPTPLVGREAEIAGIRAELTDPATRLLTLIGPVGTGKSRLAAAVARDPFPGTEVAVRVVDLALDAAMPDVPLPAGRVLLLLDNADSVPGGLVARIVDLFARHPGLTVLATSREPLGVYGERRWAVGPLRLPAGDEPVHQVPSVALFVQRARAAAPGFALTDDNRDDVAEICRQLDGLPLAVELAAARMRVFQPRALLLRLQDRLDVLEGRSADTLSRHRTMRAALAASYEQLSPDEQAVVRRLSVFPADFGLEAAEAVVGGLDRPVDLLLESLLDRSIVGTAQTRNGEPRFVLLRTVRRFAQEQLRDAGELPETYRRLAAHARAVAETLGSDPRTRLVVPTGEQQAIAEAVRWLLRDGDLAAAVSVLDALLPYWLAHGQGSEVRRWVAEAVRACEAAGDRATAARAHRVAGVLAAALADPEAAVDALHRALELHRELGDDTGAAVALTHLGRVATRAGDTRRARRVLGDAVELAAGDPATRALALRHLAVALATDGETDAATRRATEAVRLWGGLGSRLERARTTTLLAVLAADRGEQPRALRLARAALREQWELPDRAGLPATLEVIAELVPVSGAEPRPAELLGAAEVLREHTATPPTPLERAIVERTTRRLAAGLGAAAVREATAQGRLAPLAEVVERALRPIGPAGPATGGDSPLTPREREVADLITRGMTNRQIARQLGIAEWTAVNHVRHIMRKLECPSRIHVARWMAGRSA